jgi:hypothetical protein
VLCATTQMEQDADSDLFGWVWVDSTTAAHNIRDRQSHVSHREVNRIRSCIGLDSFYPITVALHKATRDKLLWSVLLCLSR